MPPSSRPVSHQQHPLLQQHKSFQKYNFELELSAPPFHHDHQQIKINGSQSSCDMSEHSGHAMLNINEPGNSLEQLAGHSSPSLADLSRTRGNADASMDSVNRPQSQERMTSLNDSGSPVLRPVVTNGERDMSVMRPTTVVSGSGSNNGQTSDGSGSNATNGQSTGSMGSSSGMNGNGSLLGGSSGNLSGLGSLSDRSGQNIRPLSGGADTRPVAGLGSDVVPSRGLTPSLRDSRGIQGMTGIDSHSSNRGVNGNLSDHGHSNMNFNPDQPNPGLMEPIRGRGRPPTISAHGGHKGISAMDHHASLRLGMQEVHLRGLREHSSHSHSGMVDHHHHQQQQQQGLHNEDNSGNNANSQNMSGFGGMDSGNNSNGGQLHHSRPNSLMSSEASNAPRNDPRDLSRNMYSSSPGDRPSVHHNSLIEETIEAVASNIHKASTNGSLSSLGHPSVMNLHGSGIGGPGIGPRPPSASHLGGHGNDDSLNELVGRHHHGHGLSVLSERGGHPLPNLMNDQGMDPGSPNSSNHPSGHQLEKTHPCLTCLKMFRSKQQLAQHSLVHTGIRKHICSFCDRAFKQLSHLQQHVRIHTGERKYICQYCERGFKQLSHLQKHIRIHTGERKYICSYCDRGFKQLSHLQQHFRIHTDERKYICQCCDKGFKQLSHLQQHFRIHTGERKYVCQICNRAFKQMTHLQQHLRIHTGERKYVCPVCNRAFKQMTHLQQHQNIHTGERKYICQICNRAFKQMTHLQQHHIIHTGERKYICQCCDRGFKQLTHLQQHYRIHTGEKPYRCKFEGCERAFAQLSNLQHHMRNHDDQVKKEATRIHKCQICHRCYTNESSLKSHTLKMHIHIKPVDQHPPPGPKKRRKRKSKDLYGDAPTMVPVNSSSEGAFPGGMTAMKQNLSRSRSPTSSDEDDEIIFVGEQMGGPPRGENFGGLSSGVGSGQGQMLQGSEGRGQDLSHQIPFSSMGNFSRGADPLALLASANRFGLQDNMVPGLGGTLNSFSDQLAFRDAALLNSRFGDLRGGPSQSSGYDDRFSSGNFNQQQREREGFGNQSDLGGGRSGSANNSNGSNNINSSNTGNGGSSSGGGGMGGNNGRNQIPAHNQGMLRGGPGGFGGAMGGAGGQTGLGMGGIMKQIKQEPLDYFPSAGDQFSGMGMGGSGGGFLSPQQLINSHLRGQLPSLNVPIIRDHFSPHNQMLQPPSSSSASSTPTSSLPPPTSTSTSLASLASIASSSSLSSSSPSLGSLPLPLSHMGLYHQSHHFPGHQRMGGLHHPPPATTPSSQLPVGGNIPSNLTTQGTRSPLGQEDLRCFSPLRN